MDDLLAWPPTWSTLFLIPALLVGFTVHELGHAMVALLLGDTSQIERKGLSFNPLRHVSWLGMVAFLLFGFGWAKPMQVNYRRFHIKNAALGVFLVSIAGPAANVLTALFVALGLLVTAAIISIVSGIPLDQIQDLLVEFLVVSEPGPDTHGLVVALSWYMISINLSLAFFNMLPIPALDGFQALVSLYTMIRGALKGTPVAGLLPRSHRGAALEELDPQSPAQIHFEIGLNYHKEGHLDEAIARYRQALVHDGQFALAYYNQGLAYWAKGRLPLAASSFKAVIPASQDPGIQTVASLRLRELARAQRDPQAQLDPAPPPLESRDGAMGPMNGTPDLDPAMARRVWLRLGIGAALGLVLALLLWIVVTAVTLVAVAQM